MDKIYEEDENHENINFEELEEINHIKTKEGIIRNSIIFVGKAKGKSVC